MVGFSSELGCSIALLLAGVVALPGPIPAELVEVVDGDTIAVRAHIWPGHSVETRVRLAGIDTAEIGRPACDAERALGRAAADFVAERVPEGSDVWLHAVELGSFAGRVVARVTLENGRDLGAMLSEADLAQPYGQSDWCGEAAGTRARD